MKAIIGTKLGMTQIIGEDGTATAVTLIQADPATVTQVKTVETDGYMAVQIGSGEARKANKAQIGHGKKANVNPKNYKEFRTEDMTEAPELGASFDVTTFEEGDVVQVTGVSKGKGWAGTVKRWNFNTSKKSHGGKGVIRKPGSIGSMYPQKVFKGKKMAGQMGGNQVSVKNLTIALVDKEHNVLGIKGAVPGPKKSTVVVEGKN